MGLNYWDFCIKILEGPDVRLGDLALWILAWVSLNHISHELLRLITLNSSDTKVVVLYPVRSTDYIILLQE